MKRYISFDIGGTNIKYGVLDEEGVFMHKDVYPSNKENGQAILDQLIETIKSHDNLSGIALSVPGLVDYQSGLISIGGAIPYFGNLNIKQYIEERIPLPVSVENDANCVGLAEKWKGNAQNETDFLCVTIGTGIGGACFFNNELYRGSNFRAGEFGYMITQGLHNNQANNCVLNRSATVAVMRERYAKFKRIPVDEVSGEDVFAAADKGDPYARHEVNELLNALSIALHNLNFILNPSKILLGGAISQREDLITELQWRMQRLNNFGIDAKLEQCRFKNDSGILGALYHHLLMSLEKGR